MSSRNPDDISATFEQASAWLETNWNPDLTVREWWDRLAGSGWGYPTWPKEYFGQGLDGSHTTAVKDAFSRIGALGPPVRAGQKLAAPTLLIHGSEDQKKRYIPRLANGQEQWTQLFSEPGAGSDLAGLRTQAVWEGSGWRVNGQKVWNSFAQYADRGILLARTDPEHPRHAGLSFFVIDLDQPGVEVRPLRQMNGNEDFNEVFFTDAWIPEENLVGGLGNGWQVAMTTLGFERHMTVATVTVLPGEKGGYLDLRAGDITDGSLEGPELGSATGSMTPIVLDVLRARGLSDDPILRQRVAALDVAERVFRALSARNSAELGPGGAGVSGSVLKLARSDLARLSRDVGLEALGPYAMLAGSSFSEGDIEHYALTSPYSSIAGGTDEIQKNIVAQRVLGLPREPVPTSVTPRSHVAKESGEANE